MSRRWLRRRYLPFAVAVLTLATYVAEFMALVPGYPTWLYFGPLTVPTVLVAPTLLCLVVLADTVGRRPSPERFDATVTGVAALTLLASVYALGSLNGTPGGVFWAGVPPVVLGGVLSLLVFLRLGVELVEPRALSRA